MGSDLYMAERSFRPGPPRVTWVSETEISVEREHFMNGYSEFYRGPATKEIMKMLKGMGITVPDNDFAMAESFITFYEVNQSTDEYHSDVIGRFWNKGDAEKFASENPGWYGSESSVNRQNLKILGTVPENVIRTKR